MALSEAALAQLGQVFDAKVQKIVDTLEGRVAKTEEKADRAHDRLDNHEQRIAQMEL